MSKVDISSVLERIYRYGMVKYIPKGRFIVRNDQTFQNIFLIIEGKAKIVSSALDGVDPLIDFLEEGDFIGDIEYYGDAYYIHSVRAVEDCEVLMIPLRSFNALLEDNLFCQFYIDSLTKKLYVSTNKSKYLSTLSAKDRFLEHLRNEAIGNTFIIPTTLGELAKQLGMTDRHMRRVMNELKSKEIIEVIKNKIYLKED